MNATRTLARFLSWLGNLLLDAAVRIEWRDWPGSDLPRIDTSNAVFHCPPPVYEPLDMDTIMRPLRCPPDCEPTK